MKNRKNQHFPFNFEPKPICNYCVFPCGRTAGTQNFYRKVHRSTESRLSIIKLYLKGQYHKILKVCERMDNLYRSCSEHHVLSRLVLFSRFKMKYCISIIIINFKTVDINTYPCEAFCVSSKSTWS